MGRRRKQTLARDLISLPWQVSAVLAVAAHVGLRWIVPALLPERSVFAAFDTLFAPLAWIASCLFGVLALLAALRARFGKGGRATPGTPAGTKRAVPTTAPLAHGATPAPPSAWSLEALRTLEWKRFELLCARYYEVVGFRTETLAAGPDGGIDVKLYKMDASIPLAVVQCKAWNARQVGVKEIRELLGVMVHAKVGRGIFATTGTYSQDARDFAAANPIQLLDGPAFVGKILALPPERQDALRAFAFSGDYRTPTCPSCGIKLLARAGKRGAAFWGCAHYPRCRSTLPMAAAAGAVPEVAA